MLNHHTKDHSVLFRFSDEAHTINTEYQLYEMVQDWKTIVPVATDAVGEPVLVVDVCNVNVFYLLRYYQHWNGKRSKKYSTTFIVCFRSLAEREAYQRYSMSRDRVAKIENFY